MACIIFISMYLQAKQQRLEEDHAAVNETLDIARGFISETERTVAEMNDIVQVRPTVGTSDCQMDLIHKLWQMERTEKCLAACCPYAPRLSLWLTKSGSMYYNLIDCDMEQQ